ncbi:MAG: DUF3048 domain-containing protein [Chloroflexi bacterium]|nr:DUF3048 domain-containing protein [Chloroflexota bacterium]
MRRLLIPLVVLVAALAGTTYAYIVFHQVTGPLTGLSVTRDVANRRPIAVMIDNISPDARPQSGLAQASLVFETLTEGGITRFMAVYLEQDAPVIGPVRSTRLYFNSWAAGLGVILGHDGGNVDALQQLPGLGSVYNEDADRIVGPFWRTTDRVPPHNEYTSTARLRAFAAAHGGSTTGSSVSLSHKGDASSSSRPAHFTLNVPFSSPDYAVTWQYDPASNAYLRFMGGRPHDDPASGSQLRAKNVVVMYTAMTSAYDPFTPGAIHLATEGSGRATVYQDGKAIDGTWNKTSVESPLKWLDGAGQPIKLNPGATWVEVVPNGTPVTAS